MVGILVTAEGGVMLIPLHAARIFAAAHAQADPSGSFRKIPK
jgi:hypothetical protein